MKNICSVRFSPPVPLPRFIGEFDVISSRCTGVHSEPIAIALPASSGGMPSVRSHVVEVGFAHAVGAVERNRHLALVVVVERELDRHGVVVAVDVST